MLFYLSGSRRSSFDRLYLHQWPRYWCVYVRHRATFSRDLRCSVLISKKYGKSIQTYFPDQNEVEELVANQGINGFYDSVQNRKDCCSVRKINPLKRALESYDVWVTGLRSEQSENRSNFKVFEYDSQFRIIKFNPLMNWTRPEVLNYLKSSNTPQNSLHQQGYVSIGCAPCTRAVREGEHSRSGRWWWESSHKECGLHLSKE